MRRIVAIAILLALIGPARADLRFERPMANLGELRAGPICEWRFEFVNAGDTAIEIVEVRRDCGCLEPVLDKKSYGPSDTGVLGFRIRTLGQPEGPRTWQAFVQYRQGGELKETRLALAATIRNEVVVQPPVLALHVEKAIRQEITVTDRRAPGLRITRVQASTPALRPTLLPQGDGVTRIVLDVAAADLAASRQEATLDLFTDDPYYRHLQVPITLTRSSAAAVTATPSLVRVQPGQAIRSYLVRLRAAEKVVIENASGSDARITCTWAAGPGNDATLKIQIDTRSPAAAGAVTVQLAAPARETLTIPVVVAAP